MFPPNKSRTFAKMSKESTVRLVRPFLKLQVNVASKFLQKKERKFHFVAPDFLKTTVAPMNPFLGMHCLL